MEETALWRPPGGCPQSLQNTWRSLTSSSGAHLFAGAKFSFLLTWASPLFRPLRAATSCSSAPEAVHLSGPPQRAAPPLVALLAPSFSRPSYLAADWLQVEAARQATGRAMEELDESRSKAQSQKNTFTQLFFDYNILTFTNFFKFYVHLEWV